MNFKLNINKLHYLLTENFKNIKLEEKYSRELGSYVQLHIKEELECNIIITKKELEDEHINWKYDSNPLSESSWVDRDCNIEDFPKLIKDIFEKKRFNSEYLKKFN